MWERAACRALSHLLFCVSFADERDRVQKKTFTKWVNKHLMKVGFFHVSLAFLILCVCAHAHTFFACVWVLVHVEAMGLMSEIVLNSSSILFFEAELIHTATLASQLALQIPCVCLLRL